MHIVESQLHVTYKGVHTVNGMAENMILALKGEAQKPSLPHPLHAKIIKMTRIVIHI